METTTYAPITKGYGQSTQASSISTPQVTVAMANGLGPGGSERTKALESAGAVPPGSPPKRKRRGADAPWQTHAAAAPEVTNGYALRKRKSPPGIEESLTPTTELPKKRVRKKVTERTKPAVPGLADTPVESPVVEEEAVEPSRSLEGSSTQVILTPKKRVRKKAIEQRRLEDILAPGLGAAPAVTMVATGTAAGGEKVASPMGKRRSRKGKERASPCPTPSVASVEFHPHNVLFLALSKNSYEDDWDSEATLDDELAYMKVNGEETDSDNSDWSASELIKDGKLVGPVSDLLLVAKPVEICGCGRILDEGREIPSVSMSQQPNPRQFLLGGFTDTQLQQCLRKKLDLEHDSQGSPAHALMLLRRQADVTEYADQFHAEVCAVTEVGENIRTIYSTMDKECDDCQRESREQIRRWEHKRDMIFDHGPSAIDLQGITMSEVVQHAQELLELKRLEARAKRQMEEEQCREMTTGRIYVPRDFF
ncbi:hypothetical protein EV426DRAFT_702099 [Tirmania nivea]|nr:hypothetical protein EV426DRAFT_702099 [Tirmania nivea]